jgi:hypothetical protein
MNNYQELVTEFKALMEKGEKDQWKLAEIAFLASQEHGGIKAFAQDVGRAPNTISMYVGAYKYRETNEIIVSDNDFSFADVITLAAMSEDRGNAVQILAGAMGKPIGTVKSDTEAINIVQAFLTENPELVKEALKDDDARSAVASAAFKAAKEDVVAEATGIAKEAAGGKVKPKVDKRGMKAVEIQRLLHDVQRASRENGALTSRWSRDFDALKDDMSVDELTEIHDALGLMYDRIYELRAMVDEARKARV